MIDPAGTLSLKYNYVIKLMSRLTVDLRTDLTLHLGPRLALSLAPVTVGDSSRGADRLQVRRAEDSVGLTNSDPLTYRAELAWLTVKNRKVSCSRGTECVSCEYWKMG